MAMPKRCNVVTSHTPMVSMTTRLIGVCIDTNVIYQSVLENRPMNRKFDQCVSQKT